MVFEFMKHLGIFNHNNIENFWRYFFKFSWTAVGVQKSRKLVEILPDVGSEYSDLPTSNWIRNFIKISMAKSFIWRWKVIIYLVDCFLIDFICIRVFVNLKDKRLNSLSGGVNVLCKKFGRINHLLCF